MNRGTTLVQDSDAGYCLGTIGDSNIIQYIFILITVESISALRGDQTYRLQPMVPAS